MDLGFKTLALYRNSEFVVEPQSGGICPDADRSRLRPTSRPFRMLLRHRLPRPLKGIGPLTPGIGSPSIHLHFKHFH